MIVDDFDVVRIAISPPKANSPLVVDPDAVLALSVAAEFLQSIARRNSQITKRSGRLEDEELPQRGSLQLYREASQPLATQHSFGVPISEGLDHLSE